MRISDWSSDVCSSDLVIGQQRAEDLNITNVADALNQIPAFRPIAGPTTTQQRSSANIAGRSLDLRGLGTARTLTLIDGRRHVAPGDAGPLDLNAKIGRASWRERGGPYG